MMPSFISHSGATGQQPNAHELRLGDRRVLLDCGAVRQQTDYLDGVERPDAVWISHAHLDHCGALVDLVARWPRVELLATKTTRRLLRSALKAGTDAGKRRVDGVVRRVTAVPYRSFHTLVHLDGARLMALPAGHVPGAAMAVVEWTQEGEKRRLLYTGDFCTHDQAVVSGAGVPHRPGGFSIDAVVSEAVLANDEQADQLVYSDEADALAEEIAAVDGPVVVGASAIADSVEVATLLSRSGVPVVVDDCFEPVFEACFDESDAASDAVSLIPRKRLAGRLEAGAVVITSGERFRSDTPAARLAELVIEDDDGAVAVVGRARSRTPAGKLVDTDGGGAIDWRGRTVELRCRVIRRRLIDHAPRWQLMGFLDAIGAEVFLVHADDGARWGLKRAMDNEGFDPEITVVEPQEVYGISTG